MRVKLIYPAQPHLLSEVPRPDGSLGLAYIAGSLRRAGIDVSILDMCVGGDHHSLEDAFHNRTPIDESSVRVGLPKEALAAEITGYDIVATTSIFTMNTQQALEIAEVTKRLDRKILTVAGGGNARALHTLFLDHGFDVVAFGEGEETIVEICRAWERKQGFDDVAGIAFRDDQGHTVITAPRAAPVDLDALPLAAWDLLPLEKYWALGDPPGGPFDPEERMRYLTMQTSRGCPFRCAYCHISRQGDAARLRQKSEERVWLEMETLSENGAQHVFLQDDSFLANRKRVMRLLEHMGRSRMRFYDYNGVNVRHLFRGPATRPVVDTELFDAMIESKMIHLAIAFESGSPRIVKKYSTNKWDRSRHDTIALTRALADRGFGTEGYFTIGYPDETLEELTETFLFAQKLVDAGLDYASFYIVTPYPDNALFEMAREGGHLPETLDWSKLKFQIPTMVNTAVPPSVLEYSRRLAYRLIHSSSRVRAKTEKTVEARASAISGALLQ